MAVKDPRIKRFLEERTEGEKESILLYIEEQIGGVQTLRNESEEELFREMLTPTKSEKGSSEEREEMENCKKDKPYLTKMMMPLLACVASQEKIPDQEWVQSECREESPKGGR